MLGKELLVESHRCCADPAGVLNQFQEKMRMRQMNVRLNRRQFHCLRLAAVGGNSIPFALLSLVCLVCFLRHNSKSKRIYAIMAVN